MQIAQDPNINAASRPRRKRSDSEDENEEDVQVTVDEGDMDMRYFYSFPSCFDWKAYLFFLAVAPTQQCGTVGMYIND